MMKFSYRFRLVYTHLNVRANEVTNSVFFFPNFHPLKLSDEVVKYDIKKTRRGSLSSDLLCNSTWVVIMKTSLVPLPIS